MKIEIYMAKNITKYSIFLASPDDLEEERFEVEDVINELNISYGNRHNLVLELLKWETHSAPGISRSHSQDLVNEDIGYDYDIFVGLIWKKFGTKTGIANSGTEEEYLNALRRFENNENIQILFYFKNTAPKNLDDINLNELLKVQQFKEKLKGQNVLYWTFNNVEEFKTNLRLHLPIRIENFTTIIQNRESILDSEMLIKNNEEIILEEDYGLFDYLIDYENLLNTASNALNNITESTNIIGNELNKKADEISRINKLNNPNNNVILELLKRVSKFMNTYSERLQAETPIFYESFKEAINMGLKYMNLMIKDDEENYYQNLRSTLESSLQLKVSIANATEGMTGLYNGVNSLPKIQSDVTAAKRKLEGHLQDLINKLEGAKQLTSEFINEIENKLANEN